MDIMNFQSKIIGQLNKTEQEDIEWELWLLLCYLVVLNNPSKLNYITVFFIFLDNKMKL